MVGPVALLVWRQVLPLAAASAEDVSFRSGGLVVLAVVVGLLILGITLEISPGEFRRVVGSRRAVVVGLVAQFVLLPAVSFVLIAVLAPPPAVALGMLLVACCPGGSISNVLTHLARGATALSISLTAAGTVIALVATPLNLALWASLNPATRGVLRAVVLDPGELVGNLALFVVLPVVVGVSLRRFRPQLAERARLPVRIGSVLALSGFVAVAVLLNVGVLAALAGTVAVLVVTHNAVALTLGAVVARLAGLAPDERRAITIEVGVQNAPLALALVLGFFQGVGAIALVAFVWGVWHLASGGALAWWWSRRPIEVPAAM
jgi:bile acid:Na+ symporter, BASS family